jgi:hypothetical protein
MSLKEELVSLKEQAKNQESQGDFWKVPQGNSVVEFLDNGEKKIVGKFNRTTNTRDETLGTEEIINFQINVEGEENNPKTWSMKYSAHAKSTYRQLVVEAVEEMNWDDFKGHKMKVKRDGTGTDTTYTFRGVNGGATGSASKDNKITKAAIREKVLRAIKKFSALDDNNMTDLKNLYKFFGFEDINKDKVDVAIDQLKTEGEVYTPKHDFIAAVIEA